MIKGSEIKMIKFKDVPNVYEMLRQAEMVLKQLKNIVEMRGSVKIRMERVK